MALAQLWRGVVRAGFYALYNPFAMTYDWVSALVSRGEWRDWTRAAIPFLQGSRILEVAVGTGNLHLDLVAAGWTPVGIDLSPQMLDITRRKFRARGLAPRLVRARVQALPFADAAFDAVVMTFPPGFAWNRAAMGELHRVLAPAGVLLWVDAPVLENDGAWGRFLNWAFSVTGGCADHDAARLLESLHKVDDGALRREWDWRVEPVRLARSRVHVFIATRREPST